MLNTILKDKDGKIVVTLIKRYQKTFDCSELDGDIFSSLDKLEEVHCDINFTRVS